MSFNTLSDQIQVILADFGVLLPEVVLILGALTLLILQLVMGNKNSTVKTALHLFLLGLISLAVSSTTSSGSYFNGLITITSVAGLAKPLFIVCLLYTSVCMALFWAI